VQNETRAKEFMEKAVKLTNDLGRRELLYVNSLADFYLKKSRSGSNRSTDAAPSDDRHRKYVKALEQIVEEFPDDLEAKTFLAFKIWDNNGRIRISSHTATDALAREVLAKNPLHPVHHARIHLWNNEADRRALDSAARCGQGSPAIAHMWHMPGHTYSALHRYADAASGQTYVYLRQTLHGLPVAYADMTVALRRDGHIVSAGGNFVAGLADARNLPTQAALSAERGLQLASRALGLGSHNDLTVTSPRTLANDGRLATHLFDVREIQRAIRTTRRAHAN